MAYTITGGAFGGNQALSNYTLSGLTGAASTFTSVATTFAANGIIYTRAVNSSAASPTTDGNTGLTFLPLIASRACVFVFGSNGPAYKTNNGANVTTQSNVVLQGQVVPWTDTSANSTRCPLPSIPDAVTPMAYVVIKAGTTTVGNWVFGSSNWNATGITIDTVVNLNRLPPNDPLTA
jgi:hypothetical protein